MGGFFDPGGGLQTFSKVFSVYVNILYPGKQMYQQQRFRGDVSGHVPAYEPVLGLSGGRDARGCL